MQSPWAATNTLARRPALGNDLRADVCVVGGGVAGLSTAYLLAREGRSVVLLEDGSLGGGETMATTAHLVTALDDRYFELERLHGLDGAKLAAESHGSAIDTVERIVHDEDIDCEFERLDGYLFAPPGDSTDDLQRELGAALRAGVRVERTPMAPIRNFDTGPALRFRDQAQFHPLKYLDGVARAAERLGARIFCDTHATTIAGGANAAVGTRTGPTVHAAAIVVATNVPINDLVAIHTKQAPYTTYVIGARVSREAVSRALYWDTHESSAASGRPQPYHYVRTAQDKTGSLLIVGGEDHKTGQESDGALRLARLAEWARERWPVGEVVFEWSGQVMETNDSLAFIGRNPLDKDNVYVVTGDSGNGMTHGTIAGVLLTDLIMGRPNRWQALYDPARITLRSAAAFAKENINVVTQYAKGYMSGSEVESEVAVAAGCGAVVRHGMSKAALYRDDAGTLHKLSAVCPHLGCVVAWNAVEKTWDCPCHGSRFSATGKVITGPANSDLKTLAG
jgi:glycine/D-amino acid oxidase-like deaminating enzyme/nitrite reductase/ring-hydroxylating ferredoxin subunit